MYITEKNPGKVWGDLSIKTFLNNGLHTEVCLMLHRIILQVCCGFLSAGQAGDKQLNLVSTTSTNARRPSLCNGIKD